ncbi:DUF4337 family protein [Frigoriglobus tundricola]|uniref:DUF4337 domain-containing protein n=1 Tax=Frigoriglobus tundricola TaxID=2774151 RepID=A0A6M5YWW5_9BACT|nr:DUF4337 family protein [Frigoriglobus tundricola]QJW97432.1 hypothetical protein FTUN_5006 [Frigoriglobus tundricola]
MANTHEHLEHAEHAEHNSHDPFNQRVAVSMAIVAALLAGISMVGHRTHNAVLQLQGDSNRLLGDVNRVIGDANRVGTEAASAETEKSNLFAWYQAKRQRQAQFENDATIIELMPGTELLGKDADEEAKKRAAGKDAKRAETVTGFRKRVAEYNKTNEKKDNLPDLIERGDEAGKRAERLRAEAAKIRSEADTFRTQAEKKTAEAEHTHHQADRLDIAHLSAEIGLVLCSIALLTKKKVYWFTGLGAAVVAIGLTASAYTIPHHHPADSHDAPTHAAPDDKGKPH